MIEHFGNAEPGIALIAVHQIAALTAVNVRSWPKAAAQNPLISTI
jgi:hypothetical protein